jgi:transcriptional regulator with XRE-family HTH domain
MRFGERLRALRCDRGRTMTSVCDAIGLSQGYLSDIENGKLNPPSADRIAQLCLTLECEEELAELLYLAKVSRVQQAFVLKTDYRTQPEIREAFCLLTRCHEAGTIAAATALKIRRILQEESTAA